jgi:predicted naringenin-chalcone synthase
VEALDHDPEGPTTRRRLREYVRAAPELAEAAARGALQDAGIHSRRITHLVTVSCTGFQAPGFDIALIKRLPLADTVARTHVGFMGCHGALNGLRVCQAFANADERAHVLLVALETCSLHYSYERNVYRLVTNALFADGAAALVGTGAPVAGEGSWRLRASGSCLFPDSEKAMTWAVGDHGFDMTLSKEVPDLLGRHLRPWLTRWLAGQDLDFDQIGSWAVHPGGPKILEGVEGGLGLTAAATAVSREILAECGNMSSPTILFVLQRMCQRGMPRPCLALGFGPGLVAEAALFD